MKSIYISPRLTVVAFKIEDGYRASVYGSTMPDDVLFHFAANDYDNSAFGNDHFNNIADDNSNYNFFGD